MVKRIFILLVAIGHTWSAFGADTNLGLSHRNVPSLTGERVIEATIQVPGSPQFDQRPLNQSPGRDRARVLLNYSIAQEGLSQNRLIVATLTSLGNNRFRARAVLPQGQQAPYPANSGPTELNTNYLARPAKIPHGASVTYRWEMQIGSQTVRGDTHEFTMPHPLVMAVMGDSYGSGEGAPHTNSTFASQVQWEDRPSHRSRNAGLMRGIRSFQRSNPELWIEARNFAISGATLATGDGAAGGIIGDYRSDRDLKVLDALLLTGVPTPVPFALNPDLRLTSQVTQLERWLSTEGFSKTHSILLAAGGNDAKFGDTIAAAITGSLSFAFGDTLRGFRGNVNTMGQTAENELVAALNDIAKPDQLLWMTYPDMTLDENGRVTAVNVDLSMNTVLMLMDAAVGADDLRNARTLLLDELNPAIRESCANIANAANNIGCRIVDIESAIGRHGINADPQNRWFNTFQDAQDEVEGVIDGAVHPNIDGYTAYVQPVVGQLTALYDPRNGSEYRRFRDQEKADAKARAREKMLARQGKESYDTAVQRAQGIAQANQNFSAGQPQVRISPQLLQSAQRNRANRLSRSNRRLTDIMKMHLQRPNLRFKIPSSATLASWRRDLQKRYGSAQVRELDLQIDQLRSVRGGLNLSSVQNSLQQVRRDELVRQQRRTQAAPVTRLASSTPTRTANQAPARVVNKAPAKVTNKSAARIVKQPSKK